MPNLADPAGACKPIATGASGEPKLVRPTLPEFNGNALSLIICARSSSPSALRPEFVYDRVALKIGSLLKLRHILEGGGDMHGLERDKHGLQHIKKASHHTATDYHQVNVRLKFDHSRQIYRNGFYCLLDSSNPRVQAQRPPTLLPGVLFAKRRITLSLTLHPEMKNTVPAHEAQITSIVSKRKHPQHF